MSEKSSIANEDEKSVLRALELKRMDSSSLALAVLERSEALAQAGHLDYELVRKAIEVATFLHRNQTRSNGKGAPRTPYIDHPLRNTLRALLWGCTDQSIILAELLHDTVEDCVDDILDTYTLSKGKVLSAKHKRVIALEWIASQFGSETALLVSAVSNPLPSGKPKTKEEKRGEYIVHAVQETSANPKVYVVKVLDFVDNAGAIRDMSARSNESMITHLALKYFPLAEHFESTVDNDEVCALLSAEGMAELRSNLQETREYLSTIL